MAGKIVSIVGTPIVFQIDETGENPELARETIETPSLPYDLQDKDEVACGYQDKAIIEICAGEYLVVAPNSTVTVIGNSYYYYKRR